MDLCREQTTPLERGSGRKGMEACLADAGVVVVAASPEDARGRARC